MLGALCVLLSLGPALKILGQTRFTIHELPIVLPYAFLTSLPGLGFMRVPGRFMLLGSVALLIAASYGLAACCARWPRFRHVIISLALVALLIEWWPRPFPQETLLVVPSFYRQLASDLQQYGVFDLPTQPDEYVTAIYQFYQMTHGKGIAAAYLSRTYACHPLFPHLIDGPRSQPDLLLNGQPADAYANALVDLARAGYRYVVWHKTVAPDAESEASARAFIDTVFEDQSPMMEDALVAVYPVPPHTDAACLTTSIRLGDNWRGAEVERRWAASPATLIVDSPGTQRVALEITPESIHDPQSNVGVGAAGRLRVQLGDTPAQTVALTAGEVTSVPLIVPPGSHTLTLSLEAGNFRPSEYGQEDETLLSFAVRSINLQALGTAASASCGDTNLRSPVLFTAKAAK
jgi:hypothetical protein